MERERERIWKVARRNNDEYRHIYIWRKKEGNNENDRVESVSQEVVAGRPSDIMTVGAWHSDHRDNGVARQRTGCEFA